MGALIDRIRRAVMNTGIRKKLLLMCGGPGADGGDRQPDAL